MEECDLRWDGGAAIQQPELQKLFVAFVYLFCQKSGGIVYFPKIEQMQKLLLHYMVYIAMIMALWQL